MLTSDDSVIIDENGFLIEASSDGSRKVVKGLEKPVRVTKLLFTIIKL